MKIKQKSNIAMVITTIKKNFYQNIQTDKKGGYS